MERALPRQMRRRAEAPVRKRTVMDTSDISPQVAVLRLLNGFRVTQLIALAARLGVADLLADGPRTADDLASATGANPDALYRTLRTLASLGIFAELDGRRFALTPLGETLQTSHPQSVRGQAIFFSEDAYRAWGDLPYAVTTGKAAFDHTFGAPHFVYLAEHPAASEQFNQAMSAIVHREIVAMVSAYDFSSASSIVDVGGGQGALLTAILRANPSLRGVLFDLPHVVAGAGPALRAADVADRCEIVSGDFFTMAPPDGDIIILSHILHDWDDERCVMILRNCAQALGTQRKILVIEDIIEPGANDLQTLLRDLQMMVMNGGRERTAIEYERLFMAAGLRLTRIIPTQTTIHIVEGTLNS
jgi:hypothetical protein